MKFSEAETASFFNLIAANLDQWIYELQHPRETKYSVLYHTILKSLELKEGIANEKDQAERVRFLRYESRYRISLTPIDYLVGWTLH